MPKINSRDKGKRGEREFLNLLGAALGKDLERNLNQSDNGGCDCVSLLPGYNLAIEIKRCEKLEVDKWWRQAVEQAAKLHAMPVLAYRQSRHPWKIMIRLDYISWYKLYLPVTVDFEVFVEILRDKSKIDLGITRDDLL